MELDVGLAVGAAGQAGGEETAGFVAVDGAAACACRVAVAGVDLDGRAARADAEFDDPLRRCWSAFAAAFLLAFALPEAFDLAVDALDPQGMPDPQGLKALQVGRQVIEHIADSRPMILSHPPRVFDFLFDNVRCGR